MAELDLDAIDKSIGSVSQFQWQRDLRALMQENVRLKARVAELEAANALVRGIRRLDETRITELEAERDRLLDAAERVNCVWSNPEMRAARKEREQREGVVHLPPPCDLIPALDALAKLLADEYGRPTGSALAPEDR